MRHIDRFVYYLGASVRILSDVDTSRSSRFRAKVESFLDTPQSAFEKRLSPHVRQIKHRGAKLRAFATWYRDDSREVLVVHFVYRKRNEAKHFDRLDAYNEEGKQFKDRFRELTDDEFEAWRRSAKNQNEVILAEF